MPDPALLIEQVLTEDERARFLAAAIRVNPQLEGAHVADLLSIYDDADAFLDRRERFYDERGRLLRPQLAEHVGEEAQAEALLRQALIAAELLGQPDEWAVGLAFQAGTAAKER